MSEKQRREIIKNLRNYAVIFDDDTIEQYLLIIEMYNNTALKRLFAVEDELAVFLEDFLSRCFESHIYMNNLTTSDILDMGEVLRGDIGSDMYNGILGYYSWLSQMAEYFSSLNINSVSKEYHDAQLNLKRISKIMRTNMFNSDIDDEVYREIIANFVNIFTTQLEDQHDTFLESCVLSMYDHNICELEESFINFNENRIDIYSTNNRTYDKIIDRVQRRLEIIADDIDYNELINLVRSILNFKMARQDLDIKQKSLQRVLISNMQ